MPSPTILEEADTVLAVHSTSEAYRLATPALRTPTIRFAFAAMAAAYCVGVVNDNFFKESSMLLAVDGHEGWVQGAMASAFVAPYLLAAAPAGWAADRFPKRTVVLGAKGFELLAVVAGSLGLWLSSWPLVISMGFLMGLQACALNPALNGLLPEIAPPGKLARANAVLKALMVIAVLGGIGLAGVVLAKGGPLLAAHFGLPLPLGKRAAVASVIVLLSLVGLLVSFGVPHRPAIATDAPFPANGPRKTLREVAAIGRDRALLVAVLLGSFVWFAGSFAVMLINRLSKEQLHCDETTTSLLLAIEMVGVAIGGAIAGTIPSLTRRWRPVASLSLGGMGALLGLVALLPSFAAAQQTTVLFVLLLLAGVLGGLALVLAESFIQSRPAPERRGAVLSAYGFVFAIGILLSGALDYLLGRVELSAAHSFIVLGTIGIATGFFGLRTREEGALS